MYLLLFIKISDIIPLPGCFSFLQYLVIKTIFLSKNLKALFSSLGIYVIKILLYIIFY